MSYTSYIILGNGDKCTVYSILIVIAPESQSFWSVVPSCLNVVVVVSVVSVTMAQSLCSDFSWIVIDKKADVMKDESAEGTERKLESNVFLMCLSVCFCDYSTVLNFQAFSPYPLWMCFNGTRVENVFYCERGKVTPGKNQINNDVSVLSLFMSLRTFKWITMLQIHVRTNQNKRPQAHTWPCELWLWTVLSRKFLSPPGSPWVFLSAGLYSCTSFCFQNTHTKHTPEHTLYGRAVLVTRQVTGSWKLLFTPAHAYDHDGMLQLKTFGSVV